MKKPKLKELPPEERRNRLRGAVQSMQALQARQPVSLELVLRMSVHLLEKRVDGSSDREGEEANR